MNAHKSLLQSMHRVISEPHLKSIRLKKIANIQSAWQEFSTGQFTLDSMPFKGIVELTQNCNFKCTMCEQSMDPRFARYNPNFNMSIDTFARIAEDFFPYAYFIDLRGFGETTILPYWPEVVDYLESHPYIHWHLVTNLSLPRPSTWEQMMKLGFTLGFSCDASSKELFESIRVRSRFPQIVENLRVVTESIRQYGMGGIYFISTIQKRNLHDLRAIVEFAHQHSVPEVQFKIAHGVGPESLEQADPQQIKECVDAAIAAGLDLGVRVTFNDWVFTKLSDATRVSAVTAIRVNFRHAFQLIPELEPEAWESSGMGRIFELMNDSSKVSVHQKCFKPFSFTYINYKAEMGTCNHMMFPDMILMGDLKKQSIKEIWNGDAYRSFRKDLYTARPKDSRCQWCFKHRMDD